MGQLFLGGVGAVVGSFFGSPQIGYLIGSTLGGALFPGELPTREGPRLDDLRVQSSAFGAPIPWVWGTARLSGNIIWSEEIEEVRNEEDVGGKGPPSQTVVSYEYFWTGAVAFAKGEATAVLQLYADGKLIYDVTGATDDVAKVNLDFRFYPGSETQEPDGIIEASEGVGETPAFRGLTYIVFDRLPLKDFGNRIPSISAVLTYQGNDVLIETELTNPAGDEDYDHMFPVHEQGIVFLYDGSDGVKVVDSRTMTIKRHKTSFGDGEGPLIPVAAMPTGDLVMEDAGPFPTNARKLFLVDGGSLEVLDSFGQNDGSLSNDANGFVAVNKNGCSYIRAGTRTFFFHAQFRTTSGDQATGLLEVTNGQFEYLWHFNNPSGNVMYGNCPGARRTSSGDGYFATGPEYGSGASNGFLFLTRVRVDTIAYYNGADTFGVDREEFGVLPATVVDGATELSRFVGPWYDETDDTIMFIVGSDVGTRLVKWDFSQGSAGKQWETSIPFSLPANFDQGGLNHSRVTDGVFALVTRDDAWAVRTTDGEVFYTTSGWSDIVDSQNGWWDSRKAAFFGQKSGGELNKWQLFRGEGEGSTTGEIVSDLCEAAGLDPGSDIDVSELTDVVPGYMLTRPSPVRDVIEPLMAAYFFDGVESDFELKFVGRDGKSVSQAFTEDDLALLDDSGTTVESVRTQEVELPLRVNVVFLDPAIDYEQQTQFAKRILNPVPTMNSRNEIQVNVPAALDSDFAKQAAEKNLYTAWNERVRYRSTVSWEHLALDPTDVVQFTLDDGTVIRARLVEDDLGADFSLQLEGLGEEPAQYQSDASAFIGESRPPNRFLSELITKLIMLNTPLLRDSDDTGRSSSVQYFAMGGYGQGGWNAASLYKSADDVNYDRFGSVLSEMTWGSTADALGAPPENDLFSVDEDNTVTVYLNVGELSSITQDELFETSRNAAALVNRSTGKVELIQFRDAVQNADDSWTLSGLLRGLRGTEPFVDAHSVGDFFVLLPVAGTGIGKSQLALTEVDAARYYKGVTSGQSLASVNATQNTSPGRDLMPRAPWEFEVTSGAPGSDITFGWTRRTRIVGDLRDGTGTVPLNEDSEAYELAILHGPDSDQEVRVISATSPSATYTAAQQDSDFPKSWTAFDLPNGSFEDGDTTNWTFTEPGSMALRDGAAGNVSGAQDGTYYVDGSEEFGVFKWEARYDVDLDDIPGAAAGADAGLLQLRPSIYIAGINDDDDTGQLNIEWLDENGATVSTSIGTATNPPVGGAWTQLQETFTAPEGARTARLTLVGQEVDVFHVDIAFDNLTLEYQFTGDPNVYARVYQMSAQVGRGFPSLELRVE